MYSQGNILKLLHLLPREIAFSSLPRPRPSYPTKLPCHPSWVGTCLQTSGLNQRALISLLSLWWRISHDIAKLKAPNLSVAYGLCHAKFILLFSWVRKESRGGNEQRQIPLLSGRWWRYGSITDIQTAWVCPKTSSCGRCWIEENSCNYYYLYNNRSCKVTYGRFLWRRADPTNAKICY